MVCFCAAQLLWRDGKLPSTRCCLCGRLVMLAERPWLFAALQQGHALRLQASLPPTAHGQCIKACLCRTPMLADSSEAMLSGRKPPFRLLVKAVHLRGAQINVRHAVSEGFVVATRRTRTAGKVRAAVDAARGWEGCRR